MIPEKSASYYIRTLHRYIGFFVIGVTLTYCISGIMLVYRDTGFLKEVKNIERTISPGLNEQKLGMVLHIKNLEVSKTEGDVIYFKDGTYNSSTGVARYTAETLPAVLEKLNRLHVSSSKSNTHILPIVYGMLLIFLAVSSFWMYKPGTKFFRRGLYVSGAGFAVALAILFI